LQEVKVGKRKVLAQLNFRLKYERKKPPEGGFFYYLGFAFVSVAVFAGFFSPGRPFSLIAILVFFSPVPVVPVVASPVGAVAWSFVDLVVVPSAATVSFLAAVVDVVVFSSQVLVLL